MSTSSQITSKASVPLETGDVPVIDPASATLEEMDERILAQGYGVVAILSPKEVNLDE